MERTWGWAGIAVAAATLALAVSAEAARPGHLPVQMAAQKSPTAGRFDVTIRTAARARCRISYAAGGRARSTSADSGSRGRVRRTVQAGSTATRFVAVCRKGRRVGSAATVIPGRAAVPRPGNLPGLGALPDVPASGTSADRQTTTELVGEPDPDAEGYGGAEPYVDGQCTRYAWRQRQDLPGNLGNAYTWDERAAAQGFPVDGAARQGDVAVWEQWSNGAAQNGHVAYVEAVHGDGTITISEWNWGRAYVRTVRRIAAAGLRFIHRKGPQFAFDEVRVYASDVVDVTAGDEVSIVVSARYAAGPAPAPCGQLNLGVSEPRDTPAGWRADSAGPWPQSVWRSPNRVAAEGCQGSVPVGARAQWRLTFRPPVDAAPGVQSVGTFSPVWDGYSWADVRVPLGVRVRSVLSASWEGQRIAPLVAPGDVARDGIEFRYRNTGRGAWKVGEVNLAVDGDRRSRIANETWGRDGNRLALTRDCAPGETCVFRGDVACPTGGPVRERIDMHPVWEGHYHFAQEIQAWQVAFCGTDRALPYLAEDYGVRWKSGTYLAGPLRRGDSAAVTGTLVNAGLACWFPAGEHPVNLRGTRPRDRRSGFLAPGDPAVVGGGQGVRLAGRVCPGEEVTVRLPLTVADWVAPATYHEYFALVAEGTTWFGEELGMYWPVTVSA
jgi:surface antigen